MPDIDQIAELFKALSDPTRLRLVKLLGSQSPPDDGMPLPGDVLPDNCLPLCNERRFLCVNALAHQLGVTQSAVSQHLRILRQAGLVRSERRGSFMHYSLDQDGLVLYKTAVKEVLGEEFEV